MVDYSFYFKQTSKRIKIYLSIFLILFAGAWTVPENYYYFKDENITCYMPKSADRAFSLDSQGQPINITNNTIYGYIQNDIRVYFPVYDRAYYYRTGSTTTYVVFDSETFETNLNLVETSTKQVDYELIILALMAAIVFLELLSFNAFRVRRGQTKI